MALCKFENRTRLITFIRITMSMTNPYFFLKMELAKVRLWVKKQGNANFIFKHNLSNSLRYNHLIQHIYITEWVKKNKIKIRTTSHVRFFFFFWAAIYSYLPSLENRESRSSTALSTVFNWSLYLYQPICNSWLWKWYRYNMDRLILTINSSNTYYSYEIKRLGDVAEVGSGFGSRIRLCFTGRNL